MKTKLTRRTFIAGAAATGLAGAAFFGPWKHNRVYAQKSNKPIKIGLTCDATGQYGDSGQDDRRGMLMAIAEFNAKGGVLGRKIETVWIDTETTPATGSRVAERMITRDEVSFLVGALHSGVANAISQVAQKYGVVYFNSNSSAPSEAGANCHRVKFVWDGNGANFSAATVQNAINSVGKDWMLLTNDYVWGHSTSKATRTLVEAGGGKIVDELLVPQGTRDFTSYLLKIQQAKPKVVAAAIGGDDIKALRTQVANLKMGDAPAWINNQQDWPDVWGQGAGSLFGVFGTTWYHYLDLPGVADFVKQYKTRYADAPIPVPGNVFYNGYMCVRELLRAVERVGSTNNIKLIKELEKLRVSAKDRMQHGDAFMDPNSHHLQQTIYMARRNMKPKDKTDLFEILSNVEATKAKDPGEVECKLESYDATPTYET